MSIYNSQYYLDAYKTARSAWGKAMKAGREDLARVIFNYSDDLEKEYLKEAKAEGMSDMQARVRMLKL